MAALAAKGRGAKFPNPPVLQNEKRIIVTCLDGVIQNEPFVIETDRNHRMNRRALDVADNRRPEFIRINTGFMERDIFYNRAILAIAGSEGGERRRREIVDTVLQPIAHGPDAEIVCAIDRAACFVYFMP
jgi:hypothetical protein